MSSGVPASASTGTDVNLGSQSFNTSSGSHNAGTAPPSNGALNVDAATYGGTFLSVKNTSGSALTMSLDATTNTMTVNGNVVVTGTVAEAAVSEGPLTITGGTVTVNTPFLQATQTWNGAGVTFTGAKVNVTDTASAAGSLLLDLQLGGVSKFSVSKAGAVTIASTLAVTGVATLTAQPIVSSLTASQAVFTDASKGLVSNAVTGTGNVVMSASPTLTGTLTARNINLTDGDTIQWSSANNRVFFNGGAFRVDVNGTQYLGISTAGLVTIPGTLAVTGATTLSSTLAVSSAAAATVTDYIATFTNTNGTGNSGSGVIKVKMSAGGTSDYVGIGLHNSGDTRIGSILQNGSSGNLTIGVGSANNTRLTFDYGTGLATFANAVTVSGATTLSGYLNIGSGYVGGLGTGDAIIKNAHYLYGETAASSDKYGLIGFTAANKVSIDINGAGAVFGGTVTLPLGGGTGLVSVGAVDSGGTGYRLLRVPN